MISAELLIGVFAILVVAIAGAYTYGRIKGFDDGWNQGFELYKRCRAKYQIVNLPDEQMKEAQVKLVEKEGAEHG